MHTFVKTNSTFRLFVLLQMKGSRDVFLNFDNIRFNVPHVLHLLFLCFYDQWLGAQDEPIMIMYWFVIVFVLCSPSNGLNLTVSVLESSIHPSLKQWLVKYSGFYENKVLDRSILATINGKNTPRFTSLHFCVVFSSSSTMTVLNYWKTLWL